MISVILDSVPTMDTKTNLHLTLKPEILNTNVNNTASLITLLIKTYLHEVLKGYQ